VCTCTSIVMALLVDESQSSVSGNSGSMQARQPPFRIYLLHRPTATPAAIAVRNSVMALSGACSLYQLAKTKIGRVTRDTLRMRWYITGA
jgi:hypothetical protein